MSPKTKISTVSVIYVQALSSLFRALGPAFVVVPLYGMFIIGGAALGVLFLNEPLSLKKLVGLTAAVAGAYLVSS